MIIQRNQQGSSIKALCEFQPHSLVVKPRFFREDGLLFRRGLDQAPLRCISADKVAKVLKKLTLEIMASIKSARGYSRKSYNLVIIALLWKPTLYPLLKNVKHVNSMIIGFTLQWLNYTIYLPPGHSIHGLLMWLILSIQLHEDMYGCLLQQSVHQMV